MGRAKRGGSVQYWALVTSMVLHAGALAVFTGVKLSADVPDAPQERPALTMEAIERAATQPKPVPHVEPIIPPAAELPEEKSPLVTATREEPPLKQETQQPETTPTVQAEAAASNEPLTETAEVEFFGQKSAVRQICYVVDCSGSMYGQMYRVKEQLKESILKLSSEQAFCVVFFMDGRQVMLSGAGRLEAATAAAKSQALNLIGQVKPGGSTDAAHALEIAMRLRGPDGHGPQVVYFLTDGFDLDAAVSQSFIEAAESARRASAPEAVIHTIGFSPEAQDRRMLYALAQNTGGEYVEVPN